MGFGRNNFENFDSVEDDVVLPELEEQNDFDFEQWEADLETEDYDEFATNSDLDKDEDVPEAGDEPDDDFVNDTYNPDAVEVDNQDPPLTSSEADERDLEPDDFKDDLYDPDGVDVDEAAESGISELNTVAEDPGEKDFAHDGYDPEGYYDNSAEYGGEDGSAPGEKRFEDYSSEELGELARTNPEAAIALNDEYQERVSAEKLGMTPEEYRAHLQRIEDANTGDVSDAEVPSKENSSNVIESVHTEQFDNPKLNGVMEITSKHCDRATEIAKASPDNGANFTDHNIDHWVQVEAKTSEAADAVEQAVESGKIYREGVVDDGSRIKFSGDIDREVLSAAALSHDTGMSDDGYALSCNKDGSYFCERQDPSNFDSVRNNHSLNSALNVLENREEYKNLGYSDSQVDSIAVLCMSHSKSNSGVRDLNDKDNWSACFDRMDCSIEAYNSDHPDNPISFDRKFFENNPDELGNLASSSLCLRVGDVSRDSGPDSLTQSGETAHVEKNTNNADATSWQTEVDSYTVIRSDGEEIISNKSKQVHIGEQNITNNRTDINESGDVLHNIKVNDGNYAPYCTQEAIKDHLGEFASAKDGNFVVNVEFITPCNEEEQQIYDDWRNDIRDNPDKKTGELYCPNVNICFPWDKEGVR